MSNNRIQTSFILNQSCVLGAVAESMLHARVDFAAPKKMVFQQPARAKARCVKLPGLRHTQGLGRAMKFPNDMLASLRHRRRNQK
jgi:hypothetical protein